jgi:hypothetical protein
LREPQWFLSPSIDWDRIQTSSRHTERWSDITLELRCMIGFGRNDHSRPSQKNGDFSRRKR